MGRRKQPVSSDAATWLASLQSVATEFQRIKADERVAEQREMVRRRRLARQKARDAADIQLQRQRTRSNCYNNSLSQARVGHSFIHSFKV